MSWLHDWPEFREPLLLWLAPLALVIFYYARRGFGTLRFSSLRLLPTSSKTFRTRLDFVPDLLIALSALAFVVALAGPRTSDARAKIKREGIAIMMVVDISSSMRALDLSAGDNDKTRLQAVLEVFRDFVSGAKDLPGRPNDAIGLVSFARYADTRSPLTLDHDSLLAVSDELEIVADRNEDGTAIGEGLGLAVERLRRSKAASKVAILLTDGVNNSGEETPTGAAQLAKEVGVKVYTIGAGTNGLAPVRVQDPFTGRDVLRQMPVEIDEKTLEDIAERTGGRYYRATDGEALRQVYRDIDSLERTEMTEERFLRYREHFQLAIALAILLAIAAWLLRASVFRRVPC